MSSDDAGVESEVSGGQANIPSRIRRELDIADGDRLQWQLEDDGTARVRVVREQAGTFAGFDGYDGETATDVASDHDAWGVNGE